MSTKRNYTGLMNKGRLGGKYVNSTNITPVAIIPTRARIFHTGLQSPSAFLKRIYSTAKAHRSATINIVILSQSGDLPKAPL